MSRLLPRFTNTRIEDEQKITQIILEVGEVEETQTVARATLPGDTRRLRGIPSIARGVAGACPGTNPLSALMASEARR